MYVQAYIENDPQVHLEIASVLATRAGDFSPRDLAVLSALMDTHCGPRNIPIIDAMTKLKDCLLYTSPSPRDLSTSRMPSPA